MQPRIAVVIPCYNYGEFLQEAVSSVLEAKRDDLELVIVDDGSTDAQTIYEIDRLIAAGFNVIRQKNSGLAASRNTAIRATTADYILPLDADNKIRPAYFEHALAILDANPRVGVVYGDAQYFGVKSDRWVQGPFDRRWLMQWNFIDACAAFRRVLWQQNGGYDGTMPAMGLEDWDMWLGAMSRGWEFAYVPEILFDYRVQQESMISKSLKDDRATEEFIARKHGMLYRDAWLEFERDRYSVMKGASHVGRLVIRRIRNKLFTSNK